jgi:hypothetical protein
MVMNELMRGAVAGAAATVPMTGVILGAKAAGLLYVPPPKQITAEAEQQTGAGANLSQGDFTLSWLAAHFGFGAAAGALFGLGRPLLPGPAWLKGLIFGTAVWAVSYLKVLPGLGLYPPPSRDRDSRTGTMIVAHLVYGSVLAELGRAWDR